MRFKKQIFDYKTYELRQYALFKNKRQLKKLGLQPIYECLRYGEFIILLTTYKEIVDLVGKLNIRKNNDYNDDDVVVCTIGYDGFVFVEDIYTDKVKKEPKGLDAEFIFVNYSNVKHYMLKHIDKNSFLFLYDL